VDGLGGSKDIGRFLSILTRRYLVILLGSIGIVIVLAGNI
jgi:hypothetical protein